MSLVSLLEWSLESPAIQHSQFCLQIVLALLVSWRLKKYSGMSNGNTIVSSETSSSIDIKNSNNTVQCNVIAKYFKILPLYFTEDTLIHSWDKRRRLLQKVTLWINRNSWIEKCVNYFRIFNWFKMWVE